MKTIQLLELADIIHPDDYIRPLVRSADFSQHDEWMETNCYGGSPLDHLRWAPVWLILGECWWGKTYGNFVNFCKGRSGVRPFEAVRGDLPESHVLQSKEWEMRHPLWFEGFLKRKSKTLKFVFPIGKYKGYTIERVLRLSEGPGYIEWFIQNVKPEWQEHYEELKVGESYKVYYNAKYKKFVHEKQRALSSN